MFRSNDMGIALFTFDRVFAPLQHLVGWLMAPGRRARASTRPHGGTGLHCEGGRGHVSWAPPARVPGLQARRPLRVLRVVDEGHAPASAGRMVISGRMADVCAELERLAALEAPQVLAPAR
jgi:hypothetical protein